MKPLKAIIRPLVALVFILCVIVDLIVLPFIHASHTTNLTDGFWLAFGGYLSVYAWGRSKEKVAGIEPEK